MDVEWSPEPTPEEREALERALALTLAGRDGRRSAWWHEGVRESVLAEPEPEPEPELS